MFVGFVRPMILGTIDTLFQRGWNVNIMLMYLLRGSRANGKAG